MARTLYKLLINILYPDNTLSRAIVLIFEILLLETDRRNELRLHTIVYYLRADVALRNKWQMAYSFSEYKIYHFFYAFIFFFAFIFHSQQLNFAQLAHEKMLSLKENTYILDIGTMWICILDFFIEFYSSHLKLKCIVRISWKKQKQEYYSYVSCVFTT